MRKILFTIFVLLATETVAIPESSIITVHCNNEIGSINKMVFGNNLVGYDPVTFEQNWSEPYYGYSDYGAGVWDVQSNTPAKETLNLARKAGIKALRFPGGCGAHHYDWKEAVGKQRQHFLFGIDEFLNMCKQIHAEPILTLSYFTGDEHDAADLIDYLNSPDQENNPNGHVNWAAARVENGHKEPYGVKYFELGNEDWHGDHRKVKKVAPKDYALKYLKYFRRMKAVDPSIKIGALLWTPEWNAAVMDIIKDKIDFGIVHTYPTPAWGKPLEAMAPKDIYAISFAKAIMDDERTYQETLKLLKAKSGRDIPLAITEYNGGFVQDKPVPYRHALGTALLNAELLRIFMKPENNILIANYWNFANEYWGMTANGFDGGPRDLYKPYRKRPNYYVFEMYHEHFGDTLVGVDVQCDSYDVGRYKSFTSRLKGLFRGKAGGKEKGIPYLSVNASRSPDGEKTYLMIINKNIFNSITAAVDFKDFIPAGEGNSWVLNGPSIDATNEEEQGEVKVTHKKFRISSERERARRRFEFTFEPHSLTAIQIERK